MAIEIRAAEPFLVEIPAESPPSVLRAEVLRHRSLPFSPSWRFRTLSVGPLRSSTAYAAHIAETSGSGFDFGDELRFGVDDGVLRTAVLGMPDRNAADAAACVAAWLDAPRVDGVLRLDAPASFNLEPADVRAMDDGGRALVCVREHGARSGGARLRVAIAEDTDLLFVDRRLAGWLLANPIEHLASSRGDDAQGDAPPPNGDLVALVQAYLAIVHDPNIERMEEGDLAIERSLLALKRRAGEAAAREPAAGEIAAQIEHVLEVFY